MSRTNGKWRARIEVNYTRYYLGRFDTPEAAHAAYCAAAYEPRGELPLVLLDRVRAAPGRFMPGPAMALIVEAGGGAEVPIEELGVVVHGRSFPQRDVVDNIALSYPCPGRFNIGFLHTAWDGNEGHASALFAAGLYRQNS